MLAVCVRHPNFPYSPSPLRVHPKFNSFGSISLDLITFPIQTAGVQLFMSLFRQACQTCPVSRIHLRKLKQIRSSTHECHLSLSVILGLVGMMAKRNHTAFCKHAHAFIDLKDTVCVFYICHCAAAPGVFWTEWRFSSDPPAATGIGILWLRPMPPLRRPARAPRQQRIGKRSMGMPTMQL